MKKTRKLLARITGFALGILGMASVTMTVQAASSKEALSSNNVGVAAILSGSGIDKNATLPRKTGDDTGDEDAEPPSDLFMADVHISMNVRLEPDEESEKIGYLYKDCGGKILDQKGGWTKIQSGDLVGWAKDDYLLFGEDAQALAQEVGNLIVTIETDALRVRKEPSEEAGVFGLIARDDELEVIEVVNDDWISVDYDGETGYVSAHYVDMDFHIDAGETLEAVKIREAEEEKRRLTANRGAVVVGGDDTKLLASLVYCEAANQGYEGQLAVAAVVMNRVRSGAYPSSVMGVIYASGQFSPALSGKVANVYNNGRIPDSCTQAAVAAINGETNVGGATHFKRVGAHDGIIIGGHVFW